MRIPKTHKTTFFLIVLMGLMPLIGYSQQQAMMTQYMFNGLAINPAYAGVQETLSLTLHNRLQWVNYPGAPNTLTFSAHSPLKNDRVALGLQVMHSSIGVTSNTSYIPSYAFRITFSEKGILSLGLQAQLTNYKNNFTELEPDDPSDIAFNQDLNNWLFNFGSGAFFYTDDYYIGFSMPLIIRNDISLNNTSNRSADLRFFYCLTGGYVFHVNEHVVIKPNVLISGEKLANKIDLNANVYLQDRLGLGVSYRWAESISFLAEFLVTKQFRIGYSYDYVTGDLSTLTSGSHEIMLNYRFSLDKGRVVNPRYF